MEQPNKNNTAVWIRQARAAKGYTQQELSTLAGISLRSVQRIENGEVVPREYTLRVLAEIVGSWPVRETAEPINTKASPETDAPANPSPALNKQRKLILSTGTGLLLVLGTFAFTAQSAHFPETVFEGLLLWMGITAVFIIILYRLWK